MAFKLSPSAINLMKDCPRCFWLHQHKVWKRPSGIFPSLPNGMDRILKTHFDKFKNKDLLPPELCENKECKNMKLFNDDERMKVWQSNFKGITWADKDGNELHGAVDNILVKGKKLIVFNDVSYIEVTPHYEGDKISIELADFSVFYNQDTIKNVEESLKNGSNKVVIENGKIIKVAKDKDGITTREILTKKWTDWIDYWAVDFDFENKKEIIKVEKQKKQTGQLDLKKEYEDKWTGDYIFENEWQSFRTKKSKDIELKTPFRKISEKRKIAIKVVDIFGNDTMKIIEVKFKK